MRIAKATAVILLLKLGENVVSRSQKNHRPHFAGDNS
jgi:hypothetical protein